MNENEKRASSSRHVQDKFQSSPCLRVSSSEKTSRQRKDISEEEAQRIKRERSANSARRFRARKRQEELYLQAAVNENTGRIRELENMVDELSAELDGPASRSLKHLKQ